MWCAVNKMNAVPHFHSSFRQDAYSGEERVYVTQWDGFWSFLESSYLRTCLQFLLAITETIKQKSGLSE